MSNNLFSPFPILDRQVVQMEHFSSSLDLPVSVMNQTTINHVSSNSESHHFSMLNNIAGENTALSVKRKAEVGPQFNNSISQQALLPNKRPALVRADVISYGFLHPSAPQRKVGPAQSKLGSPGLQAQPPLNKKMVRNDSIPGKSGSQRVQTAKKPTVQIESTPKIQRESSEALRSKMRESLASALALAYQNQEIVSSIEKNQSDTTNDHQMPLKSLSESESSIVGKTNDCHATVELPSIEGGMTGGQTFQELQNASILPDEEVSLSNNFYAKDDLLQGNGLSWAFDKYGLIMVEKETQGNVAGEQAAILTPENLALKIEAELFKLFGGVNKKYKEKGRSLLFNLKDRNNPELRERVMSDEISPERLCSMSAEELASKELSEWRMAKAEEMAQMVVLPEVDIRRFVRKTHKGEIQVEVQHDDGIAAEISSGFSMLTQTQPKKEIENLSPSEESPKDKENEYLSGSLIIPTDGTDLMQGIMVDDLKDVEYLPPIVSLDEFMESLDSEPPFEDLATDKTIVSHNESPKGVNESRVSNQASDSPKDAPSKIADIAVKSSGSPVKEKVSPSVVPKVDYIWEGILQLTISSSVTVGGLLQSGEKTSIKEWPTSLEIKGRVKVDAFEKFLQQLPMSRTRAVMIVEFVLRDKSSNNELSNLSEAIDSYAADERLGFAEPAPGFELYLCPPTPKMADMLSKHLKAKDQPQTDSSIENRLIGVVVWRKSHISNTISPNSSSHHKNIFKKQHFGPSKSVRDYSSNVNVNVFNNVSHSKPQPEEDDEIPPGFGHVAAARAAKDDDDLPEFNFNEPAPLDLRRGVNQRPVDQVRELIQKYGQSGSSMVDNRGVGIIKQWNKDDEDDDMPEWTPQAAHQRQHQPYPVARGPRPAVNMLHLNQSMAQIVNPPPPHGGVWVQPRGAPYGAGWRQH